MLEFNRDKVTKTIEEIERTRAAAAVDFARYQSEQLTQRESDLVEKIYSGGGSQKRVLNGSRLESMRSLQSKSTGERLLLGS